MGRGVARQSLEHPGALEQPLVDRPALRKVAQVGRELERALERHAEAVRDHPRDAVDVGERQPQGAPDVAHHPLRSHGAEGDDLGDVAFAVAALHVIDHLAAPQVVEVDVDVRHADPLGVQEPLEDQAVPQRIDVGDPERVGHQRPGHRAAARAHADPAPARVRDEVADDQEVGGEPHAADHVELVLEAAPDLLADRVEPLAELRPGQLAQVVLGARRPGRKRELREQRPPEAELEIAALGDLEGAAQRVGEVAEALPHLLGRLEVDLVGQVAETVRVVHRLAGLDAEQDVVGVGVLVPQVVAVVGGDQRDPGALRQRAHALADLILDLEAVVLDLEVEVPGPEHLAVEHRGAERAVGVVVDEIARHLTLGAGRQRDQALGVRREQLVVDARLVVEALEEGERREAHEVLEAALVARQEHQVVRRLPGAVVAAPAGDVGLHAQDRLDAGLPGRLVELHGPEQGAVVGEGQGRHAELGGPLHHAGDRARAVEQRVVAVVVEVDELGLLHGASCARGRSSKGGRRGPGTVLRRQSITKLPETRDEFPARSATCASKRCAPRRGAWSGRQRSVCSSESHSLGIRFPSTRKNDRDGSTPLPPSSSRASSAQRL